MAFGELSDPATIAAIISVVIIAIVAVVIVIFAMRKGGKKPEKTPQKAGTEPELAGLPFKISKSVQSTDASHAKDELRILDLEREILSDAIRRLYEAHAEGKISEQERERLAGTYKTRMMTVKDSIAKDETIVALHELEGMQEDLMKLFSERFGEITSKVEELRTKIDVKPIKEIKVQIPHTFTARANRKNQRGRRRRRRGRRKTEKEEETARKAKPQNGSREENRRNQNRSGKSLRQTGTDGN